MPDHQQPLAATTPVKASKRASLEAFGFKVTKVSKLSKQDSPADGAKRTQDDREALPVTDGAPSAAETPECDAEKGSAAPISYGNIATREHVAELETRVMHPSWRAALRREFSLPYYRAIKSFLADELASGQVVYPPLERVFEWSKFTPADRVRVVVLGQDPYHGPGQAHGLCFSVAPGVPPPPSLGNIYKAIEGDKDLSAAFTRPKHGYLGGWAEQGVLLLNAVLTVRRGQANSHANKGWEKFTDAVVSYLNHSHERLVFLLWGAHAQRKGAGIDKKKHLVLMATHPSPLSAHRPPTFFECRHFSKANNYLREHGKEEIQWHQLPLPCVGC